MELEYFFVSFWGVCLFSGANLLLVSGRVSNPSFFWEGWAWLGIWVSTPGIWGLGRTWGFWMIRYWTSWVLPIVKGYGWGQHRWKCRISIDTLSKAMKAMEISWNLLSNMRKHLEVVDSPPGMVGLKIASYPCELWWRLDKTSWRRLSCPKNIGWSWCFAWIFWSSHPDIDDFHSLTYLVDIPIITKQASRELGQIIDMYLVYWGTMDWSRCEIAIQDLTNRPSFRISLDDYEGNLHLWQVGYAPKVCC